MLYEARRKIEEANAMRQHVESQLADMAEINYMRPDREGLRYHVVPHAAQVVFGWGNYTHMATKEQTIALRDFLVYCYPLDK
jgi:hypothetical protein